MGLPPAWVSLRRAMVLPPGHGTTGMCWRRIYRFAIHPYFSVCQRKRGALIMARLCCSLRGSSAPGLAAEAGASLCTSTKCAQKDWRGRPATGTCGRREHRVEPASSHRRASPTCPVPAFGGDKTPTCHRRFPGFVGTGSLTDSASVAMPDVIPDHATAGGPLYHPAIPVDWGGPLQVCTFALVPRETPRL